MTPLDPYSVLGVAPSAGPDEVKAAYRARARLVHPDFHRDARGGAPQAAHDAFAQLCTAYQLALGNLDNARSALRGVDESLGRTAPAARPAVPEARTSAEAMPATVVGPTVSESFDWRGTVLLVGLAVLGWLFVTEWVPALLEYSAA
jgi:hypothetical protein